jgi:hypothetical protein
VGVVALAGLAIALALLAMRGSGQGAAVALALTLGSILLVEGCTYPPRFAEWSNIRGFTAAMGERLPAEARVLAYPDAGLFYDFYLRRSIRELSGPSDLEAELAGPRPGDVLLMRERGWDAVRPRAEARWQVLLADRVGRDRVVLLGQRP